MLYFDAYSSLSALPADQRGELLLLLYQYAMAADKAPTDPETILEQCPSLSGEAKMAYRFLAGTIQRDTNKWKEKQQRYQAAAQRRAEEARRGQASGAGRGKGDPSWIRPYLERRKQEWE